MESILLKTKKINYMIVMCIIKNFYFEFYKNKNTDNDKIWKNILLKYNIKVVMLKEKVNMQKLSYLRLFFTNNKIWYNECKIKALGWLVDELIPPIIEEPFYKSYLDLMIYILKENGYIRTPYYMTMEEILTKGYLSLFLYLIREYFTFVNVSNILNINETFTRDLFSTKKVYIIYGKHRISSIRNFITKGDVKLVLYLIKNVKIKLNNEERSLIEEKYPYISKLIFLAF